MDLVEGEAKQVSPVDYKRGQTPEVEGNAWEPDRIQVCAQGLILRDNGYEADEGFVYYVASRQRVRVVFDASLIRRTEEVLAGLRSMADGAVIPPPLADSPKCPRCSLVGICLPDELNHLAEPASVTEPRRLVPARDDALPVYVQSQGMTVAKSEDRMEIR